MKGCIPAKSLGNITLYLPRLWYRLFWYCFFLIVAHFNYLPDLLAWSIDLPFTVYFFLKLALLMMVGDVNLFCVVYYICKRLLCDKFVLFCLTYYRFNRHNLLPSVRKLHFIMSLFVCFHVILYFCYLSVCFFYFVLILYYLLENKYDDDVLVDRQCRLLNIYLLHCFVW